MARYQITAPDGRVVTVEGDSAPTEQEAAEIFGQMERFRNQPSTPEAVRSDRIRQQVQAEPRSATPSALPPVAPVGAGPQVPPSSDASVFRQPETWRSTVTGMTGQEAQERRELGGKIVGEPAANVLRYGIPVAAGVAATPFTGGMSGLGSVAMLSGIGAVSAASGEALAQSVESGEGNPDDILAAGIMGATPMVKVGSLRPFMPMLKRAGVVAGRAGVTGLASAGTAELSDMVRMGEEYQAPKTAGDAWDRLTRPEALIGAGLGGIGGAIEARAVNARQAAAARGDGARGVLATEISPNLAPLEARRVIVGDPKARTALMDLYADIDTTIAQTYANAPSSNQIAREIAPEVGRLKELQAAAREADKAAVAAEVARQNTVGKSAQEMRRIAEEATARAGEAAKLRAQYELGVDAAFGAQKPSLAALSPARNTETLGQVIKTTFDEQKSALGRMWDEVGIGINDPIFSRDDAIRRVKMLASRKGSALQGNEAQAAALAQIDAIFPQPSQQAATPIILDALGNPIPAAKPNQGVVTATREQYINLRDQIAANLEKNGLTRRTAGKIAGETYAAIRGAADDYISVNLPDKAAAWDKFNKTAANWFEARDSAFIQDFVNPSTGELRQGKAAEFVGRLAKGQTEGFDSLVKLGNAIAANGDEASIAAAKMFKDGVSSYISKGILDTAAINRTTAGALDQAVFDTKKLYETVNRMSSAGFPVENLGFGSKDDLAALARIGGNKMTTRDELADFFTNVRTLGGNAAAARITYRRELRDQLLNRLLGRNVNENVRKATAAAQRAKVDAAAANRALADAQKDPLVALLGEGSFGFTNDLTSPNLGKAVSELQTVDAPMVRRFMDALDSSRPQVAQQLRARTAADVLASAAEALPAGATPQANQASLRQFFYGTDAVSQNRRAAVREIMGPQEYRNFQSLADKIAPRIRSEMQLRRQISQIQGGGGDAMQGAIAGSGFLTGNVTTGVVKAAAVGNIRRLLDNGQYSTLHLLYIDPKWSRRFASAAYNLDKFANQSPVNRILLQAAEKQDAEARERSRGQETQSQ